MAAIAIVSILLFIGAVVFAATRMFSFPVIAVSVVYVFLMVEALSILWTFLTLRFYPKVFEYINGNQDSMAYSSADGLFGDQDNVHTAGSSTGDYQAPDMEKAD